MLKHSASLRAMAEATPRHLMGLGAGPRLAPERDGASSRPEEPADRAQERRLAGAVGADDADDLAGVKLKTDPMQDLHSPVAGLDCVDHEQRSRLLPSLRVGQGTPPALADCRGSPRARPGPARRRGS